MEMKKHYFGEWVEIIDESEIEEATQYLSLWSKYFQRRVEPLKFIESQIIYKPKGTYRNKDMATLGLKIEMEGDKPDNLLSPKDLTYGNE